VVDHTPPTTFEKFFIDLLIVKKKKRKIAGKVTLNWFEFLGTDALLRK